MSPLNLTKNSCYIKKMKKMKMMKNYLKIMKMIRKMNYEIKMINLSIKE